MQYFREHYPDFPKGRLIPSESPDFILKISRKKSIGIELTQLTDSIDVFADLTGLIEKKEEKVRRYQDMDLKELWLIIYAEDVFGKSSVNLRNKLQNQKFKSSFNRMFLFDLFSKSILEFQ